MVFFKEVSTTVICFGERYPSSYSTCMSFLSASSRHRRTRFMVMMTPCILDAGLHLITSAIFPFAKSSPLTILSHGPMRHTYIFRLCYARRLFTPQSIHKCLPRCIRMFPRTYNNNFSGYSSFLFSSNMAATKIIVPILIVLMTCSQPTIAAPRARDDSSIKQPGSSNSADGSSTTRYAILTHAPTKLHSSATSPVSLGDTSWIMPPPPVLQNDGLDWKSNMGGLIAPRKLPSSNNASISTSTSPFITPLAPSISNDGLYTVDSTPPLPTTTSTSSIPFTMPPAPILQNGGLHFATPISPLTFSLPSTSTKWTSSTSVVEPVSTSALGFTVLPQTKSAPR